jgi:Tfp pilus assembly protein PilX
MNHEHATHVDPAVDPRPDRGSAMIMTLMVMMLVTVLSTTVAVVTINNLQSSSRSRQAGAALSAADAGVAQAVSYLRSSGVGDLKCSPSCTGNAGNPKNVWGDKTDPAVVSMPGVAGQSYRVWIESIAPFPANNPGKYRIHSTGLAAGAASRPVSADVSIASTNSGVPKGIFARSVTGGGNASVARQSVFSTGCVTNRSKIGMTDGEIDVAYGIPVAVHSSGSIAAKTDCTKEGSIHSAEACNATFPYDQDLYGGRLESGDGCYDAKMTGTGTWAKYFSAYDLDGVASTKEPGSLLRSKEDMYSIFGFKPFLSQGYLDTMRMLAKAQGNYYTSASTWSSPTTTDNEVVMFFDLAKTDPGGLVDLKNLDSKFGREPIHTIDGACPARSLTIVIEGGNARLNGSAQLAATLILTSGGAPAGTVSKANGNAKFIGTIFADTVQLVGTVDLSMDACFLANAGPGLTEIAVTSYQENDRGLG